MRGNCFTSWSIVTVSNAGVDMSREADESDVVIVGGACSWHTSQATGRGERSRDTHLCDGEFEGSGDW